MMTDLDGRRGDRRVVEVAGGRAFVSPGGDAGLVRGTIVQLRKRRFPVIEVSATSAVMCSTLAI